MAILITGGAGYIGSHTCVELLNAGYDIVVVDNFVNSKLIALERVFQITGRNFKIYNMDSTKKEKLERVFSENQIDAVIHFAGLKAVGESVQEPLMYYYNNIMSSVVLCEVMNQYNVKKLVFSSSATVYGMPDRFPISENFALSATNPYGRTKLFIEHILQDLYVSDKSWSIALLRYFNPIGAHKSGLIGEDPNGIPNNLMPYITQVAVRKLKELSIFGNSYPTADGTGVRDYIHVVDLAAGHVKAIDKILNDVGIEAYNLGTGKGYSVLEMVHAFEKVNHIRIPYRIAEARQGDVAICYADPSKANQELGWVAKQGIEEMCLDSWRWQKQNPNGYKVVNQIEEVGSLQSSGDFFNLKESQLK